MKIYVKPIIEFIELTVEEKLAAGCTMRLIDKKHCNRTPSQHFLARP